VRTAVATTSTSKTKSSRQRVPSSERRNALIDAAVHEFARGGLHGTPVDRIARSVGVAQPYVFSLFGNKRELFLAAVERGFDRVVAAFTAAASRPEAGGLDNPVLMAMGTAYVELLASDRDALMLQHQAYAACEDPIIRDRVRAAYARLVTRVQELSGATQDELDEFLRHGMWLNVAAAMGVPDISVGCEWVRAEQQVQLHDGEPPVPRP
jgi:AcrR family transcriptional regulator